MSDSVEKPPVDPALNRPDPFQTDAVKKVLAKLPPKKAAFVTALCSGRSNIDALLFAGWQCTRASASAIAGKMLREDVDVQQAVDVIKSAMVDAAGYDKAAYVAELDSAIRFARETRNANALGKLLELKGKAHGLIIDKAENKNLNAGLRINIVGIETKPQ